MNEALKRWTNVPVERRQTLRELLKMESEGGGWIPGELFVEEPTKATQQAGDIQALVAMLEELELAE